MNLNERMVLDLDLNNPPPSENSTRSSSPELLVQGNGISQGQTTNVVEIDDDDDIEMISPRDFAEATRNSRRNQGLEFESFEDWLILSEAEQRLPGYAIMDLYEICDRPNYVAVNQSPSVATNPRVDTVVTSPIATSPTATPAAHSFACGICMEPLVEETSTKCGHIFCKICIDAAILNQRKCPTCRQKLNRRDTIRIYLPNLS